MSERYAGAMPGVFALCEDATVTGTEFYAMECVEGRVLRDPALPELGWRQVERLTA